MVNNVTTKNFEQEVVKSKEPVIIDFWAPWCGPCRMMGPVFEELSKGYAGKLKFLKLNVDEEGELSQKYDVMSIPCLVVFNKGEEVDRIVGFAPKPAMKEKIDEILSKIEE